MYKKKNEKTTSRNEEDGRDIRKTMRSLSGGITAAEEKIEKPQDEMEETSREQGAGQKSLKRNEQHREGLQAELKRNNLRIIWSGREKRHSMEC